MIDSFRHEALNQATVIAGFSEIIENLVQKQALPVHPEFLSMLQKIKALILSFNQTLLAFREESLMHCAGVSLPENPEDIWGALTPACGIHYGVLQDFAGELLKAAEKIASVDIGDLHVASRFSMIQEAIQKLNALLTDPVAYLKKAGLGE